MNTLKAEPGLRHFTVLMKKNNVKDCLPLVTSRNIALTFPLRGVYVVTLCFVNKVFIC